MAEQTVPAPETQPEAGQSTAVFDTALKSLHEKIAEQGNQITQLLQYIEDSPAIYKTGYFTQDGGTADKNVKSLGDWLMAIARGDEARLAKHYGSTKDVSGDAGSSGGWLLPSEFMPNLMQIVPMETPALARVNRMRVNTRSGEIPALDTFTAVTAGVGQTAAAGRVTTAGRTEGGTYTETQPQFEQIDYKVTDAASGYIEVSKEMRTDSPFAIEALLSRLINIAVNAKLEFYILRGTGVGQPLGVLNAPALIAVNSDTDNAFVFADAVEINSRFRSFGGQGVWLAHPSAQPDLSTFAVGTTMTTLINDMQASLPMQILGHPLTYSEHMSQTNSAYDIGLFDFSAYWLFERGGLYIDFSEHAAFTSGKDTWRFGMRCDGQPWLKSAITLADPTGGFTQSAFVVNNDQ